MEEVNKNTELDNTDKKLHISDVSESKTIRGNNLILDLSDFEKLSREVGYYNYKSNIKEYNEDGDELYDEDAIKKYGVLREKRLIMLEELIKFYSHTNFQSKNKVKNEQLNILVGGWLLFKEFMPELNQKIEIYWSTDEITKQIWRNDIPWTGNELPRFWRADVNESNSYPLDKYKSLNDILSAHDVLDKLSFSEKKIKVFYTKDAPKDTTGNVMTMEDATLFAFEYAKRLLEKMNYSH